MKNSRPLLLWVAILLPMLIACWIAYAIGQAAVYFASSGSSMKLLTAYVPAAIAAVVCVLASVALYRRKRWVRWLFVIPPIGFAFQVIALIPYLFMAAQGIRDPAARASVGFMIAGGLQPLVFLVISAAATVGV